MHQDFVRQVLQALVSGYLAREGLKDRFRSLNEYEIARRVGITEYSYAQFDSCHERIELQEALTRLEQQGLVSLGPTSGRYATFAPTVSGTALVSAAGPDEVATSAPEGSGGELDDAELQGRTAEIINTAVARLERKLDEIIRLLRSIEQGIIHDREQRRQD